MTDIDYDELAARPGTVAVIDVRTMAEHSGEAGYPCDPRQGHIPGASQVVAAAARCPRQLVRGGNLPVPPDPLPWSALRTGATRRHEWSRLAEE
jgi:hypothetical protein